MATDYIERLPDADHRTDCEWCADPEWHDRPSYAEAGYVLIAAVVMDDEPESTALCDHCARDWIQARIRADLHSEHSACTL